MFSTPSEKPTEKSTPVNYGASGKKLFIEKSGDKALRRLISVQHGMRK